LKRLRHPPNQLMRPSTTSVVHLKHQLVFTRMERHQGQINQTISMFWSMLQESLTLIVGLEEVWGMSLTESSHLRIKA